jgi:hypothetical protein
MHLSPALQVLRFDGTGRLAPPTDWGRLSRIGTSIALLKRFECRWLSTGHAYWRPCDVPGTRSFNPTFPPTGEAAARRSSRGSKRNARHCGQTETWPWTCLRVCSPICFPANRIGAPAMSSSICRASTTMVAFGPCPRTRSKLGLQ